MIPVLAMGLPRSSFSIEFFELADDGFAISGLGRYFSLISFFNTETRRDGVTQRFSIEIIR